MQRTIVIQCKECKGTGLIEKGRGAAVVCWCCEGKGKVDFTYDEFEGRKVATVNRVFPSPKDDKNINYFYADKDYKMPNGKIMHFSRYGCTYDEWKDGINPKPMEELYCPAEFFIGMKNINEIGKSELRNRCQKGASLGICIWYYDKANCWRRWKKN